MDPRTGAANVSEVPQMEMPSTESEVRELVRTGKYGEAFRLRERLASGAQFTGIERDVYLIVGAIHRL